MKNFTKKWQICLKRKKKKKLKLGINNQYKIVGCFCAYVFPLITFKKSDIMYNNSVETKGWVINFLQRFD